MNEIPQTRVPEFMTALHLVGNGGPEMLVLRDDVPVPVPADDEVLVRVRACAMNNTDVNTRVGWYSKAVTGATDTGGFDADPSVGDVSDDGTWGGSGLAFPRIQGADPCGEVVSVGSAVHDDLLGRRVLADGWIRDADDPADRTKAGYLGSERDGGYAQYCTIPVRNVHAVDPVDGEPLPLTDAELASFPCSWATAEHMLTRPRVSAADTVVVLDGDVLGKPGTPEVATAMLERLSGRIHHVVTGVAVAGPGGAASTAVSTEVVWRTLSNEEVSAYVATGEPLDKAGGYGIQGGGADFVASLVGSRDNVVGLPVTTALELLASVEVADDPWRR